MRNYVRYIISLEEPVKMGMQGNQANSEALTYIAGSTLRGAVIREELLMQGIVDASKELEKSAYVDLFSNTHFFDAYIVNGERYMIPVPFVYYADKHAVRENERRASENAEIPLEIHTCIGELPKEGEQRVDVSRYCYISDQMYSQGVRKTANLHISVKNKKEVFRYEAISEGQEFAGVIECRDEETADHFKTLLSDRVLYLGGSKGSGYGRCRIREAVCMDYERLLDGYHIRREGQGGILTVYALSNLLLVDENGKNSGEISAQYLKEKLQLEYVELQHSYVATTMASGFNHTWKAGQVQQTAVKAGSVYVYSYQGTLDWNLVAALERGMIGNRKQDGFGRILINAAWSQTSRVALHTNHYEHAGNQLSEEDRNVLCMIQDSINQDRITALIKRQALEYAEKSRPLVRKFSLSQIARLYNATEKWMTPDLDDTTRTQEIRKFYESIFERTTITGERADRTGKTTEAYAIAKLILPNGTREMKDVLKDMMSGSNDDWGIQHPDDSCMSFFNKSPESRVSLLELKIRFLNAMMYNLMRKEGGH